MPAANCLIIPIGLDIVPVDPNDPDTALRCVFTYTATILDGTGMVLMYSINGVPQSVSYTGSVFAGAGENAATLQDKMATNARSALGLSALFPVNFIFDRKGL